MATILAYLTFNGNCRQAMSFYKDCFGGELTLETVKGSPMQSHWPEEVQTNILHSNLSSDTISILGSDMMEQKELTPGNNVTLALICNTKEEIESYFNKLSKGGKVKYPLHDFYNGKIGGVVDRYGINWFLKL